MMFYRISHTLLQAISLICFCLVSPISVKAQEVLPDLQSPNFVPVLNDELRRIRNNSGGGGGTECVTAPCNLNIGTTLNFKNICLADGTNCLSSSSQWTTNGNDIYNNNTGNVGIGADATTPVGHLTVSPGDDTVAQFVLLENGSNLLTVLQDGAFEYDGNNLYFTHGSSRAQLQEQLGNRVNVKAHNTDWVVDASDDTAYIYAFNTLAAPRSVTLPAAATMGAITDKIIIVKDQSNNAGTNNITIIPDGTEKIDGASTLVINKNDGAAAIYSDAANNAWRILYTYPPPTGTGVDNHIVRWDGTTALQNSTAILSDDGSLTNTATKSAVGAANTYAGHSLTANFTGSGTQLAVMGVYVKANNSTASNITAAASLFADVPDNIATHIGSVGTIVAHGPMVIDSSNDGALWFNNGGFDTVGINPHSPSLKMGTSGNGINARPAFNIYGDVDGNPSHRGIPTLSFGDGVDSSAQISLNFSTGSSTPISMDITQTTLDSQVNIAQSMLVHPGLLTVTSGYVTIHPQTTTAGTAPIKIPVIGSPSALMTVPEAGALEASFNWYLTNTQAIRMPVVGGLFDHFADAGNTGTGEDDLYSDTLLADNFIVNGDTVTARYSGIFVGSATASRQVRTYLGGSKIYDSGVIVATQDTSWDMSVMAERDSSSAVRCTTTFNLGPDDTAVPKAKYTRVTGLNLTATQIIKITGEAAGVGAATNDIVATSGKGILAPAKL